MLKKIVKKVIPYKTPLDAYRFHIDVVSEESISGWAHKIGDGNYTVSIEIRHNNVVLCTTEANIVREDLKAAAIGSGQYGFSVDPKKIKVDQVVDYIDIFIDGLKANITPLPLTLSAAKPSKAKAQEKSSIPPTKISPTKASVNTHKAHVDHASLKKVIGWAKKKDSVTHRTLVELRVGNIVIGSGTADTFRESIKNAGIGDGFYCFEIKPVVHLFPSTNISCDLFLDGEKSNVSSIKLNVTEQELDEAKYAYEFSDEISNFGSSVSQELTRLTNEIEANNGNAINVAIENIASLSVRVEVIEKILTKHFTKK